ncbi:MAG TPA: hypothetical protein VG317_00640 [Pseudonocardiaceae bacterium]|jgi:hypothetical protein|nr:hypothetical protein [Pseudonocardiaceae bacterium]
MSCHVAGFAKIESGAKITSSAQPDEIIFYFGADDELVQVFDQDSLSEFIAVAEKTLEQARAKSLAVAGS